MKTMFKGTALAAVMLITGLLIGLLSRNAVSQGTGAPSSSADIGRYQIVTCGQSMNPYVYFVDTKTGHVWLKSMPGSLDWVEQKTPPPASENAVGR